MYATRSKISVTIDPSLGCGAEESRLLGEALTSVGGEVAVFRSCFCPVMLMVERSMTEAGGECRFVRPASAEEVLTAYGGSGLTMADRSVEWQEREKDALVRGPAMVLWTGEVLSSCHRNISSPFYAIEAAAEAWAFGEGVRGPEDVCAVQVVRWFCAERFARVMIEQADQYDRLRRFWVSPIRSVDVRELRFPRGRQ